MFHVNVRLPTTMLLNIKLNTSPKFTKKSMLSMSQLIGTKKELNTTQSKDKLFTK